MSYLNEFDYRYKTRKIADGQRTWIALEQAEGKRLRYTDTQKRG